MGSSRAARLAGYIPARIPTPAPTPSASRMDHGATLAGSGETDNDGRCRTLIDQPLQASIYRLTFATGAYFGAGQTFFPEAVIVFEVVDPAQHYHVPLLVSPFGYSTYRGS